jgi:hypothetical protein
MAILALLLGKLELDAPVPEAETRLYPIAAPQTPCPNPNCISQTEKRHARHAFKLTSHNPLRAICGFCSQELPIGLVGCSTTRHFHPRDSASARQIRPDHLIFFRDEAEAEAMGFSAATR